MSDFRVTIVGANYAMDVTTLLTGVNRALPEPERTEMMNYEKNDAFWDAWNAATERKEGGR